MKTTGVVRKVDNVGRIVLPKEFCKVLHINSKDALEMSIVDSSIVLRKYEPHCTLCGGTDNIIAYENKNFCKECIENLGKLI